MSESQNLNSNFNNSENGVHQLYKRPRNNNEESIFWRHFRPIRPSYGSDTKCTFDGCNTKYIWRGSTTNLIRHLKRKHHVTTESSALTTSIQSSSTNNFINFDSNINLPLIKFIVSSISPFSIVDHLKSSGLVNLHITSSIIEEQIIKVYDRLFSQLKSKVQQAKSVMLSIEEYNEYRDEWKYIISCCWLTEDFEFHKILLCVKETFEDIIEALDKWELTNLKFIRNNLEDFLECYDDCCYMLEEKYKDIVRIDYEILYVDCDSDYLIIDSLSRWAETNTNINYQENDHGISTIITSIINATNSLCGVVNFLKDQVTQNAANIINMPINNFNCYDCHYHKIEFLNALGKQDFEFFINNSSIFNRLSLDKLPFSIFPKLLELFKPLEHVKINERNIADMLTSASNILAEISQSVDLERRALKSFIIFLLNLYAPKKISKFLDPHSELNINLDETIKKIVLNKCQDYYSQFPGFSNNNLEIARKELEYYINRKHCLPHLNEKLGLYEWWQQSNHTFPGLATIAQEYLPLTQNNKVTLNIRKFEDTYQDDDIVDKIAFLHYNMKYI
ncbi:15415_t:CDS:2 [Gigaspora margarita]|uniref:15415_t:CDS:1 n=1 Tax=Gigaspora margarita TaxID=4874 RepID=A0ABN7V7U4_GIGMA|nr:15415_t:CDS:2 [Gigaspora margarita]